MMNQWTLVGKIKSARGLNGELNVLIFAHETSWKNKLKIFGLASDEKSVVNSLEVETIKTFKEGLIIKAKGVLDRTQAEKVIGKLFFIPSNLLISKQGEVIFLHEILNFLVFDQDQRIGVITRFSSNGPQDLLVIKKDNAEMANAVVEVPFVEAFIVKIDFENKSIYMNLPEGLLTLESE